MLLLGTVSDILEVVAWLRHVQPRCEAPIQGFKYQVELRLEAIDEVGEVFEGRSQGWAEDRFELLVEAWTLQLCHFLRARWVLSRRRGLV